MTRVICDMSMSLAGDITGPNDSRENPFGDSAEMLHDWIFDAATDEDRAVLQDVRDSVGAIVVGRTSFDKSEGDGGRDDGGALGDTPCIVVRITRRKDPIRRSTRSSPTACHGDRAGQADSGRSRRSRWAWSTRSACT